MKSLIYGVLPRDRTGVGTRAAHLGGVVADVYWSDLQTTEGGAIATSGVGMLEIVNTLATGLPVRVRIHCGRHAPDWAKNLGTGPLDLHSVYDGSDTFTSPVYWETAFLDAFDDFMVKMAAAVIPSGAYAGQTLEGCAEIREVAVHPATTEYAEPFLRGLASATVATAGPNVGLKLLAIMTAAGLDSTTYVAGSPTTGPANDMAAILYPADITTGGQSRWFNYGWETTRWYIPHNKYQTYRSDTGAYVLDPLDWTLTAMETFRDNMGEQAVLANNSWRVPMSYFGSSFGSLYQDLNQTTGSPMGIQTATLPRILEAYQTISGKGSATSWEALTACIDAALGVITESDDPLNLISMPVVTANRATSVELPGSWGTTGVTDAQLDAWNAFVNPASDATFTTTVGSATADGGGVSTFTGGAALTTLAGAALASGGVGEFTISPDAYFGTLVGVARASGLRGTFTDGRVYVYRDRNRGGGKPKRPLSYRHTEDIQHPLRRG